MRSTQSSNYSPPKYRPDIDGLRAIAVLSVVAYHASPMQIKGGFIGVDIFFVISGFLISTIIFQNLERNSFSFSGFYSRRIKRIFPALLLVLSFCVLLGWVGLYSDEYKQLGKHIVAGSGFLSNFLLWQESGYFDSLAETKPLLHLWSLGIEEQFYILCPVLLRYFWKQRLNPLLPIVLLFIISFILNIKNILTDSIGTFYSPQTRFWELLVGVILAQQTLWGHSRLVLKVKSIFSPEKLNNAISMVGFGLLLTGFVFISKECLFPGMWALLPTLGAAFIIGAGSHAWLNKNILANKVMVWFGLISFPLYLWHWPILSFLHIINQNDPSRTVRLFAVLASILLAWLTYHFLEKPVRYGKKNKITPLVTVSTVILLMGFVIYQNNGFPFRMNPLAKKNSWTDKQQVIAGYEQHSIYHQAPVLKGRDFFLSNVGSERANIAIIGDSHANRLYWALASFKELKLINLGRGTCPPLIDVEVFQNNGEAVNCQPLTNNYLHYVKEAPNIKLIVINAFYNQYQRDFTLKAQDEVTSVAVALNNTLDYFKASQKQVIVALDIPEVPGTCYQRSFPVWQIKPNAVCTISKNEFNLQNQPILNVLNSHPEVTVFHPEAFFCKEQCGEIDAHKFLYLRDGNHLNDYGLAKLSPAIHDLLIQKLG